MRDAERLALEIRNVADGDPWFGSSASALLADVDAEMAATKPAGARHSIWELVLHTTAWAEHVSYRLAGGAPGEPARGNWPVAAATSAEAWRAAVDDLRAAHDEPAAAVASLTDAELDEPMPASPDDDLSRTMTRYRVAAGVAQHGAYHCGQIAAVKTLLASLGG